MECQRVPDRPAPPSGSAAAVHDTSSTAGRRRQSSPDNTHFPRTRGSSSYPSSRHASPSPLRLSVSAGSRPGENASSPAMDRVTDSKNQVDPDLVALVASQVINTLKSQGLSSAKIATTGSDNLSTTPPRNMYSSPLSTTRDTGLPSRNETADNPVRRASSSLSKASARSHSCDAHEHAQPPSKADEATTLERAWQPLFDGTTAPTPRLAQFLRGLAVHIIEEFEPVNSIVITPEKMKRFYDSTAVSDETYPWTAIFGGKISNSSLSHLYRDLGCEHHFVQRLGAFDGKPCIPSLTPYGFEAWFTHAIRSHPDQEWARFSKAIVSLPISNYYDRKERFPKELPRRLFPCASDDKIRVYFEDSILADPAISLLPPLNRNVSAPAAACSRVGIMQNRESPRLSPLDSAPARHHTRRDTDNTEYRTDIPPAMPTERARNPYVGQVGASRQHDATDRPPQRSNTISSTGSRAGREGSSVPERKGRAGSASSTGNQYGSLQMARSPSRCGPRCCYTRSDDRVHEGVFSAGSPTDDESRKRALDIRQDRASAARQYVMEETQKSTVAADDELYRRRLSVAGVQPGPPPPPPPASLSRT